MKKSIVVLSLFIVILILFNYTEDIIPLHDKDCGAEVTEFMSQNKSQFLSDNYFYNLDEIFKQLSKDNSKKVAAKAILNRMMDDLESNPNMLPNNKNFKVFLDTFDKNIRKLDSITQRMHYFRNTLNSYSGAPIKLDDMIELAAKGEWHLFDAKFHRYYFDSINGALNVKFLSSDGRFEAVYNTQTGKIVTDPANMGTYNYAPGSINPIKFLYHTQYDKNPWKKWGNVEGFSYKDIMSLKSGHGTDEAKNNEKKIERQIETKRVKNKE